MIGQHIYSRCLEGYFSKSLSADSTTVTISAGMFAREEQAKRIARECEGISTLEDVRQVPENLQGVYRGVLKIRRLNRQLTVVCRSYRLHSEQGQFGGGESRDFTFASSYLLSGEEKKKFLRNPEYCLNVQDFEPYPSVMTRIEESRARGGSGRIEANPEYSLFRSPYHEANFRVFSQAGFSRELFIDYISSVIQRVSYAHYSGHEKDKVLVVLPRQFNPAWEVSGGNGYAEAVLAATMKLLPECVRDQMNATTGGMHDPGAAVLDGYQLVFMEPDPTRDWKKSEYSIIDLNRMESFVTEGLDRAYGEFLWDHLLDDEARMEFERQYISLFGEETAAESDHSPEKFSFVMRLLQEEAGGFSHGETRSALLRDLIVYCGDSWTERGKAAAIQMLGKELESPGYAKGLEKELLVLIKKDACPEELKRYLLQGIVLYVLHGDGSAEGVEFLSRGVHNGDSLIINEVRRMNQQVYSDQRTPWHTRGSLLDFYLNICKDSDIHADVRAKQEILSILSAWYLRFLERSEWEQCALIMQILAEQLEDPRLDEKGRGEIYADMIYLLFFAEGEGRKQVTEILKKEERKFASEPEHARLFWERFREQIQEKSAPVNDDVIWQMTYLAVSRDEEFLGRDWEPVYKAWISNFSGEARQNVMDRIQEDFNGWTRNVRDPQRRRLVYLAMAAAERKNLECGYPFVPPSITLLQPLLAALEEQGLARAASELLYMRYQAEKNREQRKSFFIRVLDLKGQWQVLISWILSSERDEFLQAALGKFCEERWKMLSVLKDYNWNSPEETAKCAQVYFLLLKYGAKKKEDSPDSLAAWCRLYQEELKEIEAVAGNSDFAQCVTRCFRTEAEKLDPSSVRELERKNLIFLKEAGILPLEGEKWKCLDVLGEIYAIDAQCGAEQFLPLRREVIRENSHHIKERYREALEERMELLPKDRSEIPLAYHLALLTEQMDQIVTGEKELNLKNLSSRIFEKTGRSEVLLTVLRLLNILRGYNAEGGDGVLDSSSVYSQLLKVVLALSDKSPELFQDEKISRCYFQLSSSDRARLERGGIRKNLERLPVEWLGVYGIREEKSVMEVLLPCLLGGLFLLLGAAALVLNYFFGAVLGTTAAVIIGGSLALLGILGDLVVLICVLVMGR